jgi:hypothetical protein
MFPITRAFLGLVILGSWSTIASAEVFLSSTRSEVIAAYGQPVSVLAAGSREILVYPHGRVVLENGQVVRLEMPRTPAAPAPVQPVVATQVPPPAPKVSPPVAPSVAPAPSEEWYTDIEAAKAEAARSKRRILTLFTGSDWCPYCIQFESEVAHHPDFLGTTRPSFVLLKLDFPRNLYVDPVARAQREDLRKLCGVNAFPSLRILSADASSFVVVDTQVSRNASDKVDYFVQAVDEARRAKPASSKSWWQW